MTNLNHFIEAPMEGTFLHATPGAVNIGDYIIRLTEGPEGAHVWGPGGFHEGWRVASNAHGTQGVWRFTYADGADTYVNPNTSILLFRPGKNTA